MEHGLGTNWYVSVADKVKALRVALKLTQDFVGTRAGYPENGRVYVSKIERGDNKVSTVKAREQLARGLGLSVEALASYLEDRSTLEETVSRASDEVSVLVAEAPAVRLPVEDVQSPLEAALAHAFDPKTHVLKDLDAVRSSLRHSHQWQAEEADFVGAARTWLDAAARLRRAGKAVDLEALLFAVTLGTKALPQQIERQEQRDAQMAEEAAEQLRAMGGEPGQGAEMGDRLKRLAKKAQREE